MKACCCGHLQLGMKSLGMAIGGIVVVVVVVVEVEVAVLVLTQLGIICLRIEIYVAVVLLFFLSFSFSVVCLSVHLSSFLLLSVFCRQQKLQLPQNSQRQ